MRSVLSLAAVAAGLLSTVSAAAEPGTLQLGFNKHKREVPAGSLRRRQTSNTANAAITNYEILYLINTTVGTPPQPIGLQLDTGSSDIWFPASNTSNCRRGYCIVGSYNQAASSTYSNPGLGTFEIEYVDGTQVAGQYISDTMTVAGVTLTNLTMAEATQVGQEFYGIMGVGFPSDESSTQLRRPFEYPNIIDVLVSEGKIATRAYSLWLDDLASNTGSILFGGVDKSKYTGSLIAIPIQRSQDSGNYTSFTVAWTGLTVVGGGQTSPMSPSSPQPAILDSGTTELYLPDDIVNNIYNGLGVVSDQNYGPSVPCDYAKDSLTFSFQFGGSNGPVVNVSLAEFILPASTSSRQPTFRSGPYSGRTLCNLGIEPTGDNPILFGDTFLRSAYVVYDLDALEIGLAQTNTEANTNEQSVIAFASSGATMPDATSTVTGVTVSATATGNNLPGQSSATATGDATSGVTRTATFSLGTATVGAAASGSSHSVAGAIQIPSVSGSMMTAIGTTIAAFLVGTILL